MDNLTYQQQPEIINELELDQRIDGLIEADNLEEMADIFAEMIMEVNDIFELLEDPVEEVQ